jgi:hypothetical protein
MEKDREEKNGREREKRKKRQRKKRRGESTAPSHFATMFKQPQVITLRKRHHAQEQLGSVNEVQ